jgi:predicted neuraminidase
LPVYYEIGKNALICPIEIQDTLLIENKCTVMPVKNQIQPALIQIGSNLHVYTRDADKLAVRHGVLDLQQNKWVKTEETNIPNPNSSVEATLSLDGKFLIVSNPDKDQRAPLSLLMSNDGKTFNNIYNFEPVGTMEYSYPALIKKRDGFYELSYTFKRRSGIKHVRFNQAWLESKYLTH